MEVKELQICVTQNSEVVQKLRTVLRLSTQDTLPYQRCSLKAAMKKPSNFDMAL
jgi:hypothetical protein